MNEMNFSIRRNIQKMSLPHIPNFPGHAVNIVVIDSAFLGSGHVRNYSNPNQCLVSFLKYHSGNRLRLPFPSWTHLKLWFHSTQTTKKTMLQKHNFIDERETSWLHACSCYHWSRFSRLSEAIAILRPCLAPWLALMCCSITGSHCSIAITTAKHEHSRICLMLFRCRGRVAMHRAWIELLSAFRIKLKIGVFDKRLKILFFHNYIQYTCNY